MHGKLFIFIIFCTVLAILAVFTGDNLSIEQLAAHEIQLRRAINRAPGMWAGIGLLIYSLVSLLPGTSGKSIVCGFFFGFLQGVVIVLTGLTAAAMISFFVCRYGIRTIIEKKFADLLTTMEPMIERDGSFYLLTLRMAHVPFTLVNYCSAVTTVSPWTFCWTTTVGLFPGTVLFVYLGSHLPNLHELADQGVGVLLTPKLIAGLLATALFPLFVRYGLQFLKTTRRQEGKMTGSNVHQEEN